MKFEKTQPENPHELAVKQHIFPRRCIARFENHGTGVQVRRVANPKTFTVGADNQIFCAMRAWDHITETLHSHNLERAYSVLVDRITSGEVLALDHQMNALVTHFHVLCGSRFEAKKHRHPDVFLKDVLPERELDKNSQEMLEKAGLLFVRPGGTMPGRIFAGIRMMMRATRLNQSGNYPRWGIWRSSDAEFIVTDNFMNVRWVPVAPSILLCADSGNATLGFDTVAELNAFQVARAEQYYFARDFPVCPIRRHTIPTTRFSVIYS